MAVIILIIVGMAVFHSVYEGIIAPSIRLSLRFRIFALRDRLRNLRVNAQVDDRVFELLHQRTNTAIRLLPNMTVSTVVEAGRAFEADAELRRRADKWTATLDQCKVKEVQEIRDGIDNNLLLAFAANSVGLLIWMLPIVFAALCIRRITAVIKELLSVPERDIDRVIRMPGDGVVAL